MSDRMTPIPFNKLIDWIILEYSSLSTIFGINEKKFYKYNSNDSFHLFGDKLASPIGPAAGPNTQLAQNIIASYITGSRFIELKTVQTLDGEDLPVSKPCILAEDEGYNVEWSTELRVSEAYDEYLKAWLLIHVFMKELNLSDEKDFIFNMSVGYDLDGIKSNKIDTFITLLQDASKAPQWNSYIEILKKRIDEFKNFSLNDLNNISSRICNSITLSTLHGCPPDEIEKIATYLIKDKRLNTFIKLNPTLLGEDFVKNSLKKLGYDYIHLNNKHFKNDLQYTDAITLINNLKLVAQLENVTFGVKLTNTLPTKILNNELPGDEMYLSGRALFPLSITLASRLANEFNGELLISYSGGVDYFNINEIASTGIAPITFATTILKPGGYERISQLAKAFDSSIYNNKNNNIDTSLLSKLAEKSLNNLYIKKNYKNFNPKKIDSTLPIFRCTTASCSNECPINQQIPQYIQLVNEKKYMEAFETIVIDNPLPSITGTLCNHNCQSKCTRNYYDESVAIRDMKLIAANNAEDEYINGLTLTNIVSTKKVLVVGAGCAGISAAIFLRRNGIDVTVVEKRKKPFGVVEYIVPQFRIDRVALKRDFLLAKQIGVNFIFDNKIEIDILNLKSQYDYIILAIGSWKSNLISLNSNTDNVLDALDFLEKYNSNRLNINLGKKVSVIGGGNVAIDVARAVKRLPGIEEVSIIYRRTQKLMPADKEELSLALNEGITITELLSPVSFENKKLVCKEMKLDHLSLNARKDIYSTDKIRILDADTVILAIGETLDSSQLTKSRLTLNKEGYPLINENNEASISNVYIAGDMKSGPASIVEAIADSKKIALDILNKEGIAADFVKFNNTIDRNTLQLRKGILSDKMQDFIEGERCLGCNKLCELCVDVCPNRANISFKIDILNKETTEVIHIDNLCNECGNCATFCPYNGRPYKDKLTIFNSEEAFNNSSNKGFILLDSNDYLFKIRDEANEVKICKLDDLNDLSEEYREIIKTYIYKYNYLIT